MASKEAVKPMDNLRFRKGQSVLEYSMVIAVLIGSLILMQSYMSRSLQGKLKDSVDGIGGESFPGIVRAPGQQVGSGEISGVLKTKSTEFEYVGEKGFSVTAGSSSMNSITRIKGEALTSGIEEINIEDLEAKAESDSAQFQADAAAIEAAVGDYGSDPDGSKAQAIMSESLGDKL